MSDPGRLNFSKHIAVIVAGGKGVRMKSGIKKQFMDLEGIPVLIRTLKAFDTCGQVDEIILVAPEPDLAFCGNTLIHPGTFALPVHLVKGGITRHDSVANGLAAARDLSAQPENTLVLIHDGVRPFINKTLVSRCIKGAREYGACIPTVRITDTIKKADRNGIIQCTLDRNCLYRAQTPQVFRLDLILKAFSHARQTGFRGTDEASVCEHAKIPVLTVAGDRFNIKLTTPDDLLFARLILSTEAMPDYIA